VICGCGGMAPRILNFGTSRGRVKVKPRPLCNWKKSHRYPLYEKLLIPRASEDIKIQKERKKNFCPTENRTPFLGHPYFTYSFYSLNCFWLAILLLCFDRPLHITHYTVDESVKVTNGWIVKWLSV